jgi:hypothetical protein
VDFPPIIVNLTKGTVSCFRTLENFFHAHEYCSSRFTPMIIGKWLVIASVLSETIVSMKQPSLLHRLKPRLHLSLTSNVPDPDGTVSHLDQVEKSIREWGPAGIGGSVGSDVPLVSGGASGTSGSVDSTLIDNLDAKLKEIENQSNSNIADLVGSASSASMQLDMVRFNMSKFTREVKANFSHVYGILDELGYASTNGVSNTARGIRSDIDALRTQINDLQGGSGLAGDYDSRISDLGKTVSTIDERVTALERRATADSTKQATEAEASDASTASSTSLQFVLESWTGRFALIALLVGVIALSLSIYTFRSLPPKPSESTQIEEETKGNEEQVLLEAGNAEGEGEEATLGYDEAGQQEEQVVQ